MQPADCNHYNCDHNTCGRLPGERQSSKEMRAQELGREGPNGKLAELEKDRRSDDEAVTRALAAVTRVRVCWSSRDI